MVKIHTILMLCIILISGCVTDSSKDKSMTPIFDEERLSHVTEKVDWKPVEPDPNIMDSGEQPGWTRLIEGCDNEIDNIDDAKSCLDKENLDKKFIIVKHEQNEEKQPILSKEPTIEPYKIEVYGNNNYAVDWQGNIYLYQTWA